MRKILLILLAFFTFIPKAGAVEYKDTDSSCHNPWKITYTGDNLSCNANNSVDISDAGGAGSGDNVTVNSTAADTTANFLDNIYLDYSLADGGAGGPDDVTSKFNFAETLAGNPALAEDECIFFADTSGGGFICEGSTADTNEQLYRFPDVNTESTNYFAMGASDGDALAGDSATSFFDAGTLEVARGGTGAGTFTDGGILLGSGTGAFTALGVATNGQIPIGDGTTDPVLATITGTANEVTITNGAGTITISLPNNAGTDISADLEEETHGTEHNGTDGDYIQETELDTEAELETQITDMANIIQATEIDTRAELEGITGDLYLDNNASDVMTGTLTADGLTLGADESVTLGTDVFDFDSGTDDFEMTNDLNLRDTDPHLQLIPASGDAFETYAFGNEWYFDNVTDSKVIWKVNGSNLIQLYNQAGFIFPDAAPTDNQILKYDTALGRFDLEVDRGGTKVVEEIVFDFTTDCATGDGKFYFHIPASMDGMNLVTVHGEAITAGTTGTMDVQIHNVDNALDMLSTKLTWDSTETGTDTAATAAVINTSNDHVNTNDVIRTDVDAVQTTAAKGMILTMEFRLP